MANFHYDVDKLTDRLIENGEIEGFLSDIGRYALICSENRRIQDILENPHVLPETKAALIETLIAPFFGWPFTAFIEQLRKNGDVAVYGRLADHIRLTARERLGVCFADVSSCVPLTEGEQSRIRAHLERLCGRRIYLTNIVDHDLLGGLMVHLEGRMIDLSVRGDLSKVRTAMLSESI